MGRESGEKRKPSAFSQVDIEGKEDDEEDEDMEDGWNNSCEQLALQST